jgi:hypothetical protein
VGKLMRDLGLTILVMTVLALIFLAYSQRDPTPELPVVHAAAPQVYANPQCAIPTLDYSKRPLRLDSKAIA